MTKTTRETPEAPAEEQGYPCWRYHATEGERVLKTAEEVEALGPGWYNHPGKARVSGDIEQVAPPVVTALLPDTAAVGAPSFTLHVQGSGFKNTDVIVFNGFDEPTTFLSDAEVTTGVDMDVWANPSAPLPVTVRRATGAESNALTFTFTANPEAMREGNKRQPEADREDARTAAPPKRKH